MITQKFNITGMTCAACSSAVERVTRKMEGVSESNVNLTTALLTITYDEAKVTPEMIIKKVDRAGFGAELFIEKTTCNHFLPAGENGRGRKFGGCSEKD